MKLSKVILSCLIAGGTMMMLPGCKPTEANYRKAYDTAKQKKQKEVTDPDIDLHNLTREDLPTRVKVDNDSAYVRQEALRLHAQGPAGPLHPYCVAVGKYRMPTNAEADAEALRTQGYNAFLILNTRSEYYVVSGAFADLPSAVAFMRKYITANPDRPYVGLPGEPVIEVPLKGKF